MAKKSPVPCKCVDLVNERLKEDGCVLLQHMQIDFSSGKASMSGPCVSVERKVRTRTSKKIPTVLCTFCPFCGKKIN